MYAALTATEKKKRDRKRPKKRRPKQKKTAGAAGAAGARAGAAKAQPARAARPARAANATTATKPAAAASATASGTGGGGGGAPAAAGRRNGVSDAIVKLETITRNYLDGAVTVSFLPPILRSVAQYVLLMGVRMLVRRVCTCFGSPAAARQVAYVVSPITTVLMSSLFRWCVCAQVPQSKHVAGPCLPAKRRDAEHRDHPRARGGG